MTTRFFGHSAPAKGFRQEHFHLKQHQPQERTDQDGDNLQPCATANRYQDSGKNSNDPAARIRAEFAGHAQETVCNNHQGDQLEAMNRGTPNWAGKLRSDQSKQK